MANMAPMTAYHGSKGMKRVEASAADRKADKGHREGSKADKRSDKTILGKHRKNRCSCK
jgi:hypothetical protein